MFAFALRKQFNFDFYAGYKPPFRSYSVRVVLWESFLRITKEVVQMKYFLFHSVSADLEEEYFTLKEIKEKVEDQKLGWKSKFKGGLEKIEVEHIEESLESRAAKEELRYDFTFYTPTCRYVRVKVSFFNFILFVNWGEIIRQNVLG